MGLEAGRLIALLVAVLLLVGLLAFTRWTYGRQSAGPPSLSDDGLLTRVATLSRRESALAFRAVLSDAGIRSTVRFPSPHRADVLVFPEDAPRAREIAASFPAA